MSDWLEGVFITAIFLIVMAVICGAIFGLDLLLKHEPIIGVPISVTLLLIIGGFVCRGARHV